MSVEDSGEALLSQWEASGRKATAEQLAGDDPELCAWLRDQIEKLRRFDGILGVDNASAPDVPGYRIVRWIGRGGMGEVWEAIQLSTKRNVALKLIRPSAQLSARARARFEREVELASRLQHPNIARVYDSGVNRGHLYYAMELVEGAALDDYVRQHSTPRKGLLSLMIAICSAVQHAHNLGVIHRDLKPGNILVDSKGDPRVLDFGLARQVLVDSDSTVTLDEAPGTPAYMSPEEASGQSRRVGTASDVYTLGVILFQLLLKRLPHDVDGGSITVMQRVAHLPPLRARAVDPSLPRELDAILVKALATDPADRYASPDALATDLRAYMDGTPVAAMRGNRLYLFRKFVTRHWGKLATAAALLAIVATVSIVAYLNIARARDDAATESQIAAAVNDFMLKRLLTAADPEFSQGSVPTLRELLDRASEEVDSAFPDKPLVEAAVRTTIAGAYNNLHEFEIAEKQLQRAFDLHVRTLGRDHPNTLKSQAALAYTLETEDVIDRARALQEDLLPRLRRVLGDLHPDTLMCLHRLGNVAILTGRTALAERYLREALEGRRQVLGNDHVDTLWSLSDLAGTLNLMNRYHEAIQIFREVHAARLRLQGENHIDTLNSELGLAIALLRVKATEAEAITLLRNNIEGRRRVYGKDNPAVSLPVHQLSMILVSQGLYTEAAELARESFRLRKPRRGLPTVESIFSLNILVVALRHLDRLHEVKEDLDRIRAFAPATREHKDLRLLGAWRELLLEAGEPEEAALVESWINQIRSTQPQ